MRYLSIILFTILCSCNDGGSDPEFVKSKRTDPTPDRQLHLDSIGNWSGTDDRIASVIGNHKMNVGSFVYNKNTDMDFDWGNPCLAKDAQTQDTVILYYDSVGRKYSSVPIRGLTPIKFEMLKIILKKEK